MPYFFSTIVVTQDFSYKILNYVWILNSTLIIDFTIQQWMGLKKKNEKGSSTNTV